MKVGLLGGSFNPAHHGHLYISNLAIKKLKLNQVWWLPTLQNPFKEKSIYADYSWRFKNCQKLSEENPKILVKSFDEIYTEKLLQKLTSRYPNYQFYWIMGADNLANLHKWKNFNKLIKIMPFAIFSRESFLLKANKMPALKIYNSLKKTGAKLPKFLIFRSKNCDLSSTKIRNHV